MDKDRTRRYPSASELAADVTRHLKTESVIARPPSLTYRASKFVRKYRAALIAVALVVTASTVISTVVQTQSVNDEAVRLAVESAVFVPAVIDVAVCDTAERVVVATSVSMKECSSGRPVSDLASVSVLTVLRGTIPSRTSSYVNGHQEPRTSDR